MSLLGLTQEETKTGYYTTVAYRGGWCGGFRGPPPPPGTTLSCIDTRIPFLAPRQQFLHSGLAYNVITNIYNHNTSHTLRNG
jgi:hypothetical protein